VIGKERFALKPQQVPVTSQVMGQTMVAGFVPSLAEIANDSVTQRFPIHLEPSGDYVMDYSSDFYPAHKFVWSAADGGIKSDGAWTYQTAKNADGEPVVSRTNKDGGTESYFYNMKNGSSEQHLPDGTVVTRLYFVAPGPAQYKIRKATSTKDGKAVSSRQWSYDEMGRLIRDRQGALEHTWSWTAQGTLASEGEYANDKTLWQATYDDQGRMVDATFGSRTYHYVYEAGQTLIQHLDKGQVVDTKVIDAAKGQALFFRQDPKSQALQQAGSSLGSRFSPQQVEAAKALVLRAMEETGEENKKGESRK